MHTSCRFGLAVYDRIKLDPMLQIEYVNTTQHLADIVTQGSFTAGTFYDAYHIWSKQFVGVFRVCERFLFQQRAGESFAASAGTKQSLFIHRIVRQEMERDMCSQARGASEHGKVCRQETKQFTETGSGASSSARRLDANRVNKELLLRGTPMDIITSGSSMILRRISRGSL